MAVLRTCVLTAVSAIGAAVFEVAPTTAAAERQSATTPAGRAGVVVLAANLREGSRLRRASDMRDGDDLRRFANRVLSRGARLPDVLLLQEVLGSAERVVRALNRHPRARPGAARFALVAAPGRRTGRECDGPRARRHRVVRDSAIVVNRQTVRCVHRQGKVRTWASWFGERGCAEHPWALLTFRDGAGGQRVRVASMHVAPTGTRLKTRAVVRTAETLMRQQRRTPDALMAIGGDLNLTRCKGPSRRAERARCRVRAAHRYLLRHGFHDAVRSRNLRQRDGVVGVRRRIELVYTTGRVRGSWFDRCYQAFEVTRYRCRPAQSWFSSRRTFHRCQYRVTMVGRPGGTCPNRGYAGYYSDHPVLRATLG
ncbi:MAG: hypothetical protein ACRDO0_19810 [Nocardioidaceae bacterium]